MDRPSRQPQDGEIGRCYADYKPDFYGVQRLERSRTFECRREAEKTQGDCPNCSQHSCDANGCCHAEGSGVIVTPFRRGPHNKFLVPRAGVQLT
jgi:hypothetical protein